MAAVPVVTIDGPGGAGKGTVGQQLAIDLEWHYLDSGALYRIVSWLVEARDYDADDIDGLVEGVKSMDIRCLPRSDRDCEILVDGTNISRVIRSQSIGDRASKLAPLSQIREALNAVQAKARREPGLIADGRDMGTVVFPDAIVKIYLHADLEIRVRRRYNQLKDKGFDASLSALRRSIEERDERDSSRELSPMAAASDAVMIDTSEMKIEAVVSQVRGLLEQRLGLV